MDRMIKKYKPIIKEKFTEDGAGWPFLQQAIIAPMSLITTVLLARILSITDYGYYKYVLSMYSIIAIFGFSGIYGITSLNMQRGQDYFFYLGFKYKKILRWIPSFISLLVSIYYFHFGNQFFGILFLMTIFSHLFVDTFDFYLSATSGKGDFKLNATLAMINYFVSFFPPILTAYLTHNLYYAFATLFICQFIFRFSAFRYVVRKFNLKNFKNHNFNVDEVKNFKNQSASFSFTAAINTFSTNASSVVVFNRLGAFDNAVYSLALTFADFIGGIMSAPLSRATLLLSQMSKNNLGDKEKLEYTRSLNKKYFFFSLLGVIFSIATLPFIYKFLFAKYFFSYKYSLVYSLSILATAFIPAYLFYYEKRNIKIINIVQISGLVINVLLLFFTAMKFGLWGVVLISMIMKFVPNLILTLSLSFKKD
jgi:O-antigen/teichoic acid export membrane protein